CTGDAVSCCAQVWSVSREADGSVHKKGHCVQGLKTPPRVIYYAPPWADLYSGEVSPHGWVLGEETYGAGGSVPVSAQYFGDKSTGALYYSYIKPTTFRNLTGHAMNVRPARIRSFKDGLLWTTLADFDRYGNEINSCTRAGEATDCSPGPSLLVDRSTEYEYVNNASYVA